MKIVWKLTSIGEKQLYDILNTGKALKLLLYVERFPYAKCHFQSFLIMGKLFILQYEGERSTLRRKENKYSVNGMQNRHQVFHKQMPLDQAGLVSYPNNWEALRDQVQKTDKDKAYNYKETDSVGNGVVPVDVGRSLIEKITGPECSELHERLSKVYEKVLVVNDISTAREVVSLLTTQYKDHVHACDTEACIGLW